MRLSPYCFVLAFLFAHPTFGAVVPSSYYNSFSCKIQPIGCLGPNSTSFLPFGKVSAAQRTAAGVNGIGEPIVIRDSENWSAPFYPQGIAGGVTAFKVMGDSILVSGVIGSKADSVRMWGVALWDGHRWISPVTQPPNSVGRYTGFLAEGKEIKLYGMLSEPTPGNELPLLAIWDGSKWGYRNPNYEIDPHFRNLASIGCLVRWNGDLLFGASGIWNWKDTTITPVLEADDGKSIISEMAVKDGDLWARGNIRGRGFAKFDGQAWSYPTLPTNWGISMAWFGKNAFFLNSRDLVPTNLTDSSVMSLLKWDGSAWSSVPLDSVPHNPRFITSDGENLYMVGPKRSLLYYSTPMYEGLWIAKWDGQKFSVIAKPEFIGYLSQVTADHGRLFLGGLFNSIDGVRADGIAMWDGSKWHSISQEIKPGLAKAAIAAVPWKGKSVFGGSGILVAGPYQARGIAGWDGVNWESFGKGLRLDKARAGESAVIDTKVNGLAVSDGNLFAGGKFDTAGNAVARNIARWDGTEWAPLANGISSEVYGIQGADGMLYAVSGSDTTPELRENYLSLSVWDGLQWHSLGNIYRFRSLAFYKGALWVSAAGEAKRWNGTGWETMDIGLSGKVGGLINFKNDLYIYEDSYNSRLYKFDGLKLDSLPGFQSIHTMVSEGDDLFALGTLNVNGDSGIALARWNGVRWTPLADNYIPFASMSILGDYLYVFLYSEQYNPINSEYCLRWNRRTGTWSRPQNRKPGTKEVAWRVLSCAQDCSLSQWLAGAEAFDLHGRKVSIGLRDKHGSSGVRVLKTQK